jgi:hypothetical protein
MSNEKKEPMEKVNQEKNSREEEERMQILFEADQVKGRQLSVDLDGNVEEVDELESFNLPKIDDPEEKYKIYYHGINKLLRNYLPKGKSFQQARQVIYDEKNVLLTRGKRKNNNGYRGADSKMGFYNEMEIVFDIVFDWAKKKGTMTDLYKELWNKNEELGFGHQLELSTTDSFKEIMRRAIEKEK